LYEGWNRLRVRFRFSRSEEIRDVKQDKGKFREVLDVIGVWLGRIGKDLG
jgi:hypothetical protein